MSTTTPTPCANCARLQAQVLALEQAVAALTQEVQSLQQRLAAATKDSSTSSKPPSSDIVKPPKPAPPAGQAKRKRGAKKLRARGGQAGTCPPGKPVAGHGPRSSARTRQLRLPSHVLP